MSFGTDIELVGVGVQSYGDTVLVGHRVNSVTGFTEGVILEIEADDGSVSESVLGTFGGNTFVTSISPNGQYVTGTSLYSDSSLPASGFLAEVSNPGVLTATGGLGPIPESFGFDVSNSGTVVGTTDGLLVPYSWSTSSGIVGLTQPNGGARGISNAEVIVGVDTTGINATTGLIVTTGFVFENGSQSFLETPEGLSSFASDISPNGEYIGGFLSFEDLTLFETINQAVVWVDGALTQLNDAEGNAFEGKVFAVSDNGYAVGQGSDGLGFIWHESFAGVRMFDEWLLDEYGETLTTPVTAVPDVLFVNQRLHFVVNGNASLVSVLAPDTSPFPYHNKVLATDVDGDGQVAPLDVLLVINALNNRGGAYKLPTSRPIGAAYLDVNKDGSVSPIDALIPINQLNRPEVITTRLIDLGAGVDVVGVAVLDNGHSVLVANRVNQSTGFSEGVIFNVDTSAGSFTESVAGSFGGDTFLTSISPNGVYFSGYSEVNSTAPFEGFRAEVANPTVLSGTGGLGPVPESFAFDVSDSGVVVGSTHGLLLPYKWEPSSGIVALIAEPNGGGGQGISAAGAIAGGTFTGMGRFNAVHWQGANQELLPTSEGFNSTAADISPDGEYIGGVVTFEDLTLFETINQPAVWSNGELTRLEDADGNAFRGRVAAVSDNGFAVGESSDGRGFIWHESFAGVRLFDEWLLTEFGLTVPSAILSVTDVYFDGVTLTFAVTGTNGLIQTPVPRSAR
ncbi:MAG: hypothetical protein H6821_09360 [Planctomycetaceae bacterium]|nr:hypothetical protein [Planctomycetaceae bacterium]